MQHWLEEVQPTLRFLLLYFWNSTSAPFFSSPELCNIFCSFDCLIVQERVVSEEEIQKLVSMGFERVSPCPWQMSFQYGKSWFPSRCLRINTLHVWTCSSLISHSADAGRSSSCSSRWRSQCSSWNSHEPAGKIFMRCLCGSYLPHCWVSSQPQGLCFFLTGLNLKKPSNFLRKEWILWNAL